MSARERFESRVRRNVENYAVDLARNGEVRKKNGVELQPGEFTTRDAEVAALAGNHMRERARRVIEALTAEGVLVETRRVRRGNGQEWVIRRASPAWVAASLLDDWEPDEEDKQAFNEVVGVEDLRACAPVLRMVAPPRGVVIPVRARRSNARPPDDYMLARIAEVESLGYTVPLIAKRSLLRKYLNQVLHQEPHWVWRKGEPTEGAKAWTQMRDDLIAVRFAPDRAD